MEPQRATEHGATRPAKACVPCRTVKMKCRLVTGQLTCERCARKALHCLFHEKKRGRKPGSRTQVIKPPTATTPGLGGNVEHYQGSAGSPNTLRRQYSEGRAHLSEQSARRATDGPEPEGVPRVDHPQEDQTPSQFSLQTVLSTSLDLRHTLFKQPTSTEQDATLSRLISHHVAASLFQGFMRSINPLICLLEPDLHTFQYVKERSTFLLAVILSSAAKAFNPPLHVTLYDFAENLLCDSFKRGTRSTEAIQAIMIFTYWKKSDDARSWSSIGYAIRLCMELGWHRLSSVTYENLSPQEIQERRNIERTWLNLFVYDRSMSLQMGKPWMIEQSAFVESVNTWYKSPYATSNDACLCALVTLRLTTADTLEVLAPQRPSSTIESSYRINVLLRMLKPQLDAWQKFWTRAAAADSCHRFLIAFFNNHVQLYLYSFSLQQSLSNHIGGPLIDNHALWTTYTSALEMLKLVVEARKQPFLGFMQDSVHIMIAYSAVFLVKLLLSVHHGIRYEIEASILETIREVAQVFAAQEAPPTFSCALQASFLTNILLEYDNALSKTRGQTSSDAVASQESSGPLLAAPSQAYANTSDSLLVEANSPNHVDSRTAVGSDVPQDTAGLVSRQGILNDQMADCQSLATNWNFDDFEAWLAMFSNAGFDIGEGVFIPDNAVREGN